MHSAAQLAGFTPPSFAALIDVLVLAVLIYQLLVLLRGTRAMHMLIGVGIVVMLIAVARFARLSTLSWLVDRFLPYAGIALIIVFSAEIRLMLSRLGRSFTRSRLTQAVAAESYEDVVLAANLFAQNRTGALIVIEREIGLRTYVESGVPLDAKLTYDLLASIFQPSAPLHDGAVIVQRDRVAAAACFLPLSMNPRLSTQLGTRHRAAIGITEESDAIAVVVSEETGAITLAVAGKIERGLSVERLRERLSDLLHLFLPALTPPTPITAEAGGDDPLAEARR
ncbi:MAG: TIGR00159 family protein [Candidatus Koribacter versatilis]|uniref:Diadenylate cyclase n=1 Tax=Candidatus Korobacter versatilis TaxID=658062 RepID=A0A932ABC9_9BACT|nr:TIGR00159 family protein [Candidatus Koribacter versatilis]